MQLFVSYSSRDDTAVKTLVRDLEATRHSVWVDQELTGGESWWQEILQRIRTCDVFVLALSNNSLRSKPCRAELEYARALGLPVVPVQIGALESPRLAPVAQIQIIDYRNPTGAVGMALVAALQDGAEQHPELPDPLPEPPPIPYEYLMRLATRIDLPVLPPADQQAIVFQLRESLETEDDDGVRDDVGKLLRRLRSRNDVTFRVASEIDGLVRQRPAAAPPKSTTPQQAPPKPISSTTGTRQPVQAPAPTPQPVPAGPPPPVANPAPRGQPPRPRPQPMPTPPVGPMRMPPQQTPSRRPAPQPTIPRSGGTGPDRQLSILGIALGAAGVLLPFLIGIVGIGGVICAGMAKTRRQPLADAALAVSIGCSAFGLILVVILASVGFYS